MPMTPKQTLYLTLCGLLCSCTDREDWLLENDPDTWQLTRTIDSWLMTYRDDDRVSTEQFQRNCDRLRALYLEPDEGRLGEVGR